MVDANLNSNVSPLSAQGTMAVAFAAIELEEKDELNELKSKMAQFEATGGSSLDFQNIKIQIRQREHETRTLSNFVHRRFETERGNNNNEQTDPHNDNHESDQDDDEESSNDGEPDNIKNYQQYGKKVRRP